MGTAMGTPGDGDGDEDRNGGRDGDARGWGWGHQGMGMGTGMGTPGVAHLPPSPPYGARRPLAEMQDPLRKGRCIRDLVRSLPPANHDTMKVLFRHLCR